MTPDYALSIAATATLAASGVKYCRNCSGDRAVAGGRFVSTANGVKRWQCAGCCARSDAVQARKRR